MFLLFSLSFSTQSQTIDTLALKQEIINVTAYVNGLKQSKIELKAILKKIENTSFNRIKHTVNKELGVASYFNSDFEEASYYYSQALKYAKISNYTEGLWAINFNLGILHTLNSEFEKATDFYEKGLNYALQLKDTVKIIRIKSALATVYEEISLFKKAKEYYGEALSLSEKIKDSFRIAKYNLRIIDLNFKNDSFKGYSPILEEVGLMVLKLQDNRLNHEYYLTLGKYYFLKNQPKLAIENGKESLKYILLTPFKDLKALTHIFLGKVYLSQEALTKAEYHFVAAEKLVLKLKSPNLESKLYNLLAKLNASKKNYPKAFKYSQMHTKLNDSILEKNNIRTLVSINGKYDNERKNNKLTRQDLELKVQENLLLRQQRKYSFFFVFLGVILLILIILLLSYKGNQRLKKQEIKKLKAENELAILESLIEGEEKERKRLAQDLHDGINGDLTALKYMISSVEKKESFQKTATKLKMGVDHLDDIIDQVRTVSHDLAPPTLLKYNLIEALETYCNNLSYGNKTNINFNFFGEHLKLKENNETAIYRIIQELLNNIVKHAKAEEALVQITHSEDNLNIIVADNGVGFKKEKKKRGLGLKNLASRTKFLNSKFDIETSPKGTTFTIDIKITNLTETSPKKKLE